MSPHPSFESVCLKVSYPILKVCFHYAIGCLCLFFLGHIGHGLLSDLEGGGVLTIVLIPHLKWGVNPHP